MLLIGGFNCLILFGLIRLFERQREEIDGFDIALAAFSPVIVLLLGRWLLGLAGLGALAGYIALALFVASIVLVLWKLAAIPLKRAALYALVVLVANIALQIVLTSV